VDDAEETPLVATRGSPRNAPLSAEEAWLLRLDLDALTDREVAEIKQYYRALKLPAPRDLEEKREAIRRVRDCKDIVRGFDDEKDFSMWTGAFTSLKPPVRVRTTEETATRRPRKKFSGQKAELADPFHRSAVLSSVLCVASHTCAMR
jgi:hypothetical protein